MESNLLDMTPENVEALIGLMLEVQAYIYSENFAKNQGPLILDTCSLSRIIGGHAFLIARNRSKIDRDSPLCKASLIAHCIMTRFLECNKDVYCGVNFFYQRALLLSFIKLFLMEVDNGCIDAKDFASEVSYIKRFFANEIGNIPNIFAGVVEQDPNKVIYYSEERIAVSNEILK